MNNYMVRQLFCGLVAMSTIVLFGCTPTKENPEASPRAINPQRVIDSVLASQPRAACAVVLDLASGKPLTITRYKGTDSAGVTVPCGSTVKPILAWLAAREGVLKPGQTFMCEGTYEGGFSCFASHGPIGLSRATATSCNVFAWELAKGLGYARVSKGLREFGLGADYGTPPAGKRWDLLVGTGHTPLTVHPVQMALAYKQLMDGLLAENSAVNDSVRKEILEGLWQTVAGDEGSGKRAAVEGVRIGGKTGTAEAALAAGVNQENRLSIDKWNGWFAGVAPLDQPQYIVVVVVLDAESGSKDAAPLAGEILRALVEDE